MERLLNHIFLYFLSLSVSFPRSIEALGPILEALKAGEEKYEN